MTIRICASEENELEVNGKTETISGEFAEIIIGWRGSAHGRDAEGLRITMRYTGSGTWSATIGQLEKTVQIPWNVTVTSRLSTHRYYMGDSSETTTLVVSVDCPDNTPVEVIQSRPLSRDDLFPF